MEWISVKERLPHYGESIEYLIAFSKFDGVKPAAFNYDDKNWYDPIGVNLIPEERGRRAKLIGVTHWMPLPQPPQERER